MIAAELDALTANPARTDERLHALLSSGQVLIEQPVVLQFLQARLTTDPHDRLTAAFRNALDPRPAGEGLEYAPQPLDVPTRIATYSINLVMIMLLFRTR